MNKTLLFLLLPGLLISCKPTPPSGDNGEIVPLTSECLLKNSDLYMKYPYKIKVQDSIMCIWDLHGGDRFYHLYSYPELQFITSFAVNGRGPEEYISTGGFCMDEQHIYVFDTSRARLSIFRKDSLMQQRISPARIIDYPQAGIPILNFCRTDQGFALLNFDGPERIAFIDTCGHLLNKKYEIPWGNTAKNKAYPTMTASLWNSYLDYNPDNHLLVLVTQNGELLVLSGLSQYIQLTVVLGLLFFLLGEAIAGFGQIHDFVAPRHLIAQMSGSFQNSESYDGLLACLLPLSLSLALRANDAPSKRYLVVPVLSGFCTFLVLTLIPASMNPCCWFIAGIGCYVVVLYHFRTFRSYKLLLRWYPKRVIFFTLLLFVLLFKIGDSMYTSMKNPEADCTFLWEQSVGLIRRSPDQGYGLGSFSQLVSTPHLSEKGSISPDSPEIWAIDNHTSYCFNEYLRITVENGIPGLLWFFLFLITAFYNALRCGQIGLSGCLLAFGIFAYFSNIFDIIPLSIILTIIPALCGRRLPFLQPHCRKRPAYCSILSQ